jgi:uncharacterized protein (TIGR02001 family)
LLLQQNHAIPRLKDTAAQSACIMPLLSCTRGGFRMKFSKTVLAAATLAGLCAAQPALAQDDEWGSLTAYVAVTSDYRFRGISQNDKEPTPQASINWSGWDGFYLGTWVSKVNFLDNVAGKGGTSYETDFYAGKHTDLWGFADLNLQAYYYAYPDHNRAGGAPRYSYSEGLVQLSHTFGDLTITGTGSWSPDYFGETGTAYYAGGTASYAIFDWLSVSGTYGHQWVNHTLPAYSYWDFGATLTYRSLAFDVRYVDTDHSAASCVAYTAGKPSWCNSGFIATLTYNMDPFPW